MKIDKKDDYLKCSCGQLICFIDQEEIDQHAKHYEPIEWIHLKWMTLPNN
jgi:hypothetical protein